MKTRRRAGFTVLELVVVLAIVSILVALGVAGYEAIGRKGSSRNAAADLYTAISQAKIEATSRGVDVWLIFYPQAARGGDGDGGTGHGAYFLYEDTNGQFLANDWASFSPASSGQPDGGRLLQKVFLDEYDNRVLFGLRPGVDAGSSTTLASSGCSFCDGTGADQRGALVFRGEGGTFLIDSGGNRSTERASLAIKSTDGQQGYLYTVSSATGFISTESH